MRFRGGPYVRSHTRARVCSRTHRRDARRALGARGWGGGAVRITADPDGSCDVFITARSAAANDPVTGQSSHSCGPDTRGPGACRPVSVLLRAPYISLETQPCEGPATLGLPQDPRVALGAVEEAGNLRLQSCHARSRDRAARLATTVA